MRSTFFTALRIRVREKSQTCQERFSSHYCCHIYSCTGLSISIYGYFDIPKAVYGQSNSNQTISNSTNLVNMQDIPLEKVCVGDIDVAYKVFGRGDPIILYSGSLNNMDDWDPSFLMQVS